MSSKSPAPLKNTKGYEDVIAGVCSAVANRMITAPFDVLKIRYQLQETTGGQRLYRGLIGSTIRIVRDEGALALWKGNIPAIAMSSVYAGTAFATNQQVKALLSDSNRKPSPMVSIISGSAAGVAATLTSYPLDLLRTRFAAQKESIGYRSVLGGFRDVMEREGIRGLYAGVSPTLAGIVPYMGLQFAFYDLLRSSFSLLHQRDEWSYLPSHVTDYLPSPSLVAPSICGAGAGVGAKIMTMPFDLLKKRLQVARFEHTFKGSVDTLSTTTSTTMNSDMKVLNPGQSQTLTSSSSSTTTTAVPASSSSSSTSQPRTTQPLPSALQLARVIYEREGILGFYRGTVPSVVKAAVSAGITFGVYEAVIRMIKHEGKEKGKSANGMRKNNHAHDNHVYNNGDGQVEEKSEGKDIYIQKDDAKYATKSHGG